MLAESEILKQKRLLPHEDGPDYGPDDGAQERHLPKLAEDENINDIRRDGVFADYGWVGERCPHTLPPPEYKFVFRGTLMKLLDKRRYGVLPKP